ncbi:MAG: aspartate aminotransferase family protein [Patescibacteria group bacterium]|nr:aspartate aminotransferase family protein [Patescibacteria group bacterium]
MLHKHLIFTECSEFKFNLSKAQGDSLYDDQGKKYLDFTSGWNVTNLGWNHPEIIEAGVKQLKQNSYSPMWLLDPTQEEYAANLTQALGADLTAIGRANGGVEAVEQALKVTRAYTGKKKIVSFYEQFHGSTLNALALGYRPEWTESLMDKRDDIIQLEYPQVYRTDQSDEELLVELENKLEEIFSQKEVAAVITEAGIITGWGATYVAPEDFIKVIRRVTQKHNVLLILDEVGTGFSRTGSLFALHKFDLKPDIVTLAKGISNGSAPIAAMVTTEEIAQKTWKETNLQSTFGWNPVACAIANKTLEIHQREKVWQLAKDKGELARSFLTEKLVDNPHVGDIRGWGLEIGVDLVKDKETKDKNAELVEKVVVECGDKNLHLVCDHESNLQLMPNLLMAEATLTEGLEILVSVLDELK